MSEDDLFMRGLEAESSAGNAAAEMDDASPTDSRADVHVHTEADAEHFHRTLARFNAMRLAPAQPTRGWKQQLQDELRMRSAEGEFVERMREEVAPMLPPKNLGADAFMLWFEALSQQGPGQHHRLFPWLAEHASMAQMRWFLRQEAAGEAGFEDLLAYTQIKLPAQPKLEFARNFWDEMGHGKPRAMHGEMLGAMVRELDLQPEIETTVWQSLALGNTMLAFATSRRYVYHSVGALGVIELTAPGRVKLVSDGMKRLGLNGRMRAYFDLHAVLDVHHSHAWNAEVIAPLVESDPSCARYVAEGALIRLVAGQRCFERYSQHLMRGQRA